jgi:hypothetical protein
MSAQMRKAIDKGKTDAAKELGKLTPAGLGGLPKGTSAEISQVTDT